MFDICMLAMGLKPRSSKFFSHDIHRAFAAGLPDLPKDLRRRIQAAIRPIDQTEEALLWFRTCVYGMRNVYGVIDDRQQQKSTLRDAVEYWPEQERGHQRRLFAMINERLGDIRRMQQALVDDFTDFGAKSEDNSELAKQFDDRTLREVRIFLNRRTAAIVSDIENIRDDFKLIGPDTGVKGGTSMNIAVMAESDLVNQILRMFASVTQKNAAEIVLAIRKTLQQEGVVTPGREKVDGRQVSSLMRAAKRRAVSKLRYS